VSAAPTVLVVGIGPAGPELVTEAARRAIASVPEDRRFLRTSRHPAAEAGAVPGARSCDDLYEAEATFPAVYAAIVERLVAAAHQAIDGRVLYAVPGSPRVGEATVDLLAADPRVEVETVAGLSFLDLAWDRLGVDPLGAGVRLVDAASFSVDAAGERGPLLVAQAWNRGLLSDIKLAVPDGGPEVGPAPKVVVLHHLGLPDERVEELAWADLDRRFEPDHLTSLWIPELASPVGSELLDLEALVRRLRQDCPWDRQQTHASLTRHLLEESYEVVEAIEALGPEPGADAYAHLEEELGDLLFQVYFHATLATEEGQFDLAAVARGIHDKLVARHPHVFGDVTVADAGQVLSNWERNKQQEKGRQSVMDGVTGSLPALHHADKVQRRAAAVGFDWDSVEGPLAKVTEELGEVRAELDAAPGAGPGQVAGAALTAEVGDLLFAAVNVARHAGVDPEAALRASSATFARRFRQVELLARDRGLDLASASLPQLDALWDEVKYSA
jgi:tetrapyrrole methylase family protein/MazG family protein